MFLWFPINYYLFVSHSITLVLFFNISDPSLVSVCVNFVCDSKYLYKYSSLTLIADIASRRNSFSNLMLIFFLGALTHLILSIH